MKTGFMEEERVKKSSEKILEVIKKNNKISAKEIAESIEISFKAGVH